MKVSMPGFDFRIHYNKEDKPDAIMFMTPEHCYNWDRYGDIFFLDASKSELNKVGWPYLGPTIRTSECKWVKHQRLLF